MFKKTTIVVTQLIFAFALGAYSCAAAQIELPKTLSGFGLVEGNYERVSGDAKTCSSGKLQLFRSSGTIISIGERLNIILAAEKTEPSEEDPCQLEHLPATWTKGKVVAEALEKCPAEGDLPARTLRGKSVLEQIDPKTILVRMEGMSQVDTSPAMSECRYQLVASAKTVLPAKKAAK